MDENSPREILASLIAERGENFGALSRLIGRNSAYIQQFIKRGTPRKLDEDDRRILAAYFGVDEMLLGGPATKRKETTYAAGPKKPRESSSLCMVPRLDLEVSAGNGAVPGEEREAGTIGFDRLWLRRQGLLPENLSIIDVKGESMSPTLNNGDKIMVDRNDSAERLRDGIYVLRLEDMLMVKRVALSPRKGRKGLTISSDNPHFPSWDDVGRSLVDIVGRVVWACRIIS